MRSLSRHIIFSILLSTLVFPGIILADNMESVPGQVLVCFADGVDATELMSGNSIGEFSILLNELSLNGGQLIFPGNTPNRASHNRFVVFESTNVDFDPVKAAKALMATAEVQSAAPNYIRPLLVMPNDPMVPTQWYLQAGSTAAVGLDLAWESETGSPASVIAIIDTGVDTTHPDLASNIWTNPNEIAGNGIDDDDNGFIDDFQGWDFGNNDNDPRPHNTPDATGIDVGFHGTHCAGIAGAVTDNNLGVAGAGWNCSLMALKLPNQNGDMTDVAITGAILYAIEEGADVISMSFGGPDQDGMAAFMQDLMDEANAANVVCVAAAGNSNTNEMFYPAACEGVISVGATDENNQRASFSTFGPWVDVAAPGNRIWSTICQNYEFGFLDGLLYMLSMGWDGTNPYMYSDGTSMACPLVAGVCGLIRNQSPGLSPDLVLERLLSTGDEVVFDQPIGVKVNAGEALSLLSAAPEVPSSHGLHLAISPNPFNPSTVIKFNLLAASYVEGKVYNSAGRLVRTLVSEQLSAGQHELNCDGSGNQGQALASGMYFVKIQTETEAVSEKLLMLK